MQIFQYNHLVAYKFKHLMQQHSWIVKQITSINQRVFSKLNQLKCADGFLQLQTQLVNASILLLVVLL